MGKLKVVCEDVAAAAAGVIFEELEIGETFVNAEEGTSSGPWIKMDSSTARLFTDGCSSWQVPRARRVERVTATLTYRRATPWAWCSGPKVDMTQRFKEACTDQKELSRLRDWVRDAFPWVPFSYWNDNKTAVVDHVISVLKERK